MIANKSKIINLVLQGVCSNFLIFPQALATFDETDSRILDTNLALTLRHNRPIKLFFATTQVQIGKKSTPPLMSGLKIITGSSASNHRLI